jgi:L-threonylcarbamoyladenylate synthase
VHGEDFVYKIRMHLQATKKSIQRGASILQQGGLVAFPTETVYGLGADALNPQAVAKIFEVKGRPTFDPLIVHIAEMEWLQRLTRHLDDIAFTLMKKFWPGPLTLVLLKLPNIPDIVTAGSDTVAVRMPSHSVAIELMKVSQTPIAAPSANLFGCLSPTRAAHIEKQLGKKIDLILDDGQCPIGVESTVLSLVGAQPVLLRPGGLPLEEIEKVIGKVPVQATTGKIQSPGQLPSHYAPRTPLKIIHALDQLPSEKNIGVLLFKKPEFKIKAVVVEVLSEDGDLREAAVNLFSALHRLDASGVKAIYAERVPEIGLGLAIMDRLRRASCKETNEITTR